jgi:2-phosphoglycerate kinase
MQTIGGLRRPALIVIGGHAGSGKTTLAHALAAELGLQAERDPCSATREQALRSRIAYAPWMQVGAIVRPQTREILH